MIAKLSLVPFEIISLTPFDSWRLHESEIQVQGNHQRFFSFLFAIRLRRFTALSRLKKNLSQVVWCIFSGFTVTAARKLNRDQKRRLGERERERECE